VLSVVVQGGNPPFASGFHLTVMGTEGQVTVDPAGPPGSLWIADWAIRARWADGGEEILEVPRRYRTTPEEVWAGPAANVAELYQALGTTLHGGRDQFPDFADAVRLHDLIAAVES
jgi:predicted dehydrogenase